MTGHISDPTTNRTLCGEDVAGRQPRTADTYCGDCVTVLLAENAKMRKRLQAIERALFTDHPK